MLPAPSATPTASPLPARERPPSASPLPSPAGSRPSTAPVLTHEPPAELQEGRRTEVVIRATRQGRPVSDLDVKLLVELPRRTVEIEGREAEPGSYVARLPRAPTGAKSFTYAFLVSSPEGETWQIGPFTMEVRSVYVPF